MLKCEFCGKEAKITWKKAQVSLLSIVRKMKELEEEEQVEILASLMKTLQNRQFDIESNEFLNIKLRRTEFVRTCSNEKGCSFWCADGVAENDAVDRIIDFEGLLIN